MTAFRHLELNGGQVIEDQTIQLTIPPTSAGYVDAQIDDYGVTGMGNGRSRYKWRPNTTLQLDARFSHSANKLRGTAGFGFWNAPFGDPTIKRPALPQAVWFFFASSPNNLPFFADAPGQGWVASTINAKSWRALRWSPFTPFVLALNHIPSFKKRVWPKVLRDLGVQTEPITAVLTKWHTYRMSWHQSGCTFWIDGKVILQTNGAPKGPLGFVCWIDNQYMVAMGNGRFAWGTLATSQTQALEIANLGIKKAVKNEK